MTTAATPAQRKAAERQRRAAEGLKRMPDIWAHPDDHAAIRAFVQALRAARFAGRSKS